MLLQSAQPALILLIGALMMKDRTGLRQIVGVVISLAGVLTVVSRGDPGVLLGLELNRGHAVIAAAVLLWAFYSVLPRPRPAVHPPRFLAVSIVAGLAVLAPASALEPARGR